MLSITAQPPSKPSIPQSDISSPSILPHRPFCFSHDAGDGGNLCPLEMRSRPAIPVPFSESHVGDAMKDDANRAHHRLCYCAGTAILSPVTFSEGHVVTFGKVMWRPVSDQFAYSLVFDPSTNPLRSTSDLCDFLKRKSCGTFQPPPHAPTICRQASNPKAFFPPHSHPFLFCDLLRRSCGILFAYYIDIFRILLRLHLAMSPGWAQSHGPHIGSRSEPARNEDSGKREILGRSLR